MTSPSTSAVAAPPRSRFIAINRRILGPIWLRVGLTAQLELPGRRTGAPHRTALFPVDLDGTTYLLSQYGLSEWVRNLRAAGRGQLRRKGRAATFTAVEVDGAERDRVIAAFNAKTPKPFRADFDQRPDAADHPTFRVDLIS